MTMFERLHRNAVWAMKASERDRLWELNWELYHFSVNRQDRKVTLRNIISFGFSARRAIEEVRALEVEP
jgi:hypothetical protein